MANIPNIPNIPDGAPNIPDIPNIPDGAPNIPDIPVGAPNIPNIPDGIPSIPNISGKAPAIPNVPSSDVIAKQLKEIKEIEKRKKEEKKRKEDEERKRQEEELKHQADKAMEEAVERAEATKQKEEKNKQEIKLLRNRFNNLTDKWDKEGRPLAQAMPQICEEYLKKLESSLTEDKHNCHFWQTPLYKKYDWESIEKCVSIHRKLVDVNCDSINWYITRINNLSKRIFSLLESLEPENDFNSFENVCNNCHDQIKKYESYINQLVDDGSLVRFFKRMNRLKKEGSIVLSGRPEPYLGKDSALRYWLSE